MYHWVCLCESVGNKLILEDALLEIQRTQVNKIIWCYHMVKRVTEQRNVVFFARKRKDWP